MFFSVTIRTYQNTLIYFLLNPFPASGESILRDPEILSAESVMEFECILTLLVTTQRTFSAFIHNRFLTNSLSAFRNSAFYVLSAISIGSFFWHIVSYTINVFTVTCSTAELRQNVLPLIGNVTILKQKKEKGNYT